MFSSVDKAPKRPLKVVETPTWLAPVLLHHDLRRPAPRFFKLQGHIVAAETTARVYGPIPRIGEGKSSHAPSLVFKKLFEIVELRFVEKIQPDHPPQQRRSVSRKALFAPIQEPQHLRREF